MSEELPPLPDLPLEPTILELMTGLHIAPDEEESSLARRLEAHLDKVRHAAHKDDYIDIGLVERIAQALERMLEVAPERSAEDQRLIATAVRYFIHERDALSDLESPTGFDDDAMVVGAVARHLELAELLPRGL